MFGQRKQQAAARSQFKARVGVVTAVQSYGAGTDTYRRKAEHLSFEKFGNFTSAELTELFDPHCGLHIKKDRLQKHVIILATASNDGFELLRDVYTVWGEPEDRQSIAEVRVGEHQTVLMNSAQQPIVVFSQAGKGRAFVATDDVLRHNAAAVLRLVGITSHDEDLRAEDMPHTLIYRRSPGDWRLQ